MNITDKALIVVSVLFIFALFMYMITRKKKSNKNTITVSQKMSNTTNIIFYRLDKILVRNRLTKRYYARMRRKIELVTPADSITVSKIAAKNTFISFFLAGLTLFAMLNLGKLDIFYILSCLFTTYVMFTYTLSNRLTKQDTALLTQFTNFLSEIRHYYYETSTGKSNGMIEEAIYASIDHVPYEMGLHATKIYEILESEDIDYEVQKYNEIAPNHFIMTFLASCACIMKFGDKKVGNDKQSVFLKSINYLKQEVNAEILKRKRMDRLFSGLVWMSIIPLFCAKPLVNMLSGSIPEMTKYFNGTMGTISQVVIFLISCLSYNMIIRLKDTATRSNKEHTLLKRIASIPVVQRMLTRQINKNYTKSLRMNDLLKSVGEKIGPNILLLQRIIFAFASVLLCNIIFVTITINLRSSVVTDINNVFDTSLISNQTYVDEMYNVCEDMVDKYKNKTPDYDALVKEITTTTKITSKTYAEMIATEVVERASEYKKIYYQWYYIPISVAIAFIASNAPVWLLRYRKKIMAMSMEDEVVQFQTIILMLMHIDRMSLEIILEWMERFANTFKEPISECILNLEMGEIQALEELKSKTNFEPFTRMVDNLITIDKYDISSAFDEIEVERSYYTEKRKDDNNAILDRKYLYGRLCGFAPLIVLGVLYVLIPFVSIFFSSYSTYSTFTMPK